MLGPTDRVVSSTSRTRSSRLSPHAHRRARRRACRPAKASPGLLVRIGVGLVLALTMAACTNSKQANSPLPGRPDAGAEQALGHVHGLGTDPADGTLYVASHFGILRAPTDGERLERVADRWQDTMAFTVVGPGHFLASGHPDLRENLPNHLGLIRTTDAARTWKAVSLQGSADFHALEVVGDRVFGYDSTRSRLLTSTSGGRSWKDLGRHRIIDLAADPADGERVLATGPAGLKWVSAVGGRERPVRNGPPLAFLDWATTALLVGISPDGTLYRSADSGRSWQRSTGNGKVLREPQALDVMPGSWHVATSSGVYRSTDDGGTWESVLSAP